MKKYWAFLFLVTSILVTMGCSAASKKKVGPPTVSQVPVAASEASIETEIAKPVAAEGKRTFRQSNPGKATIHGILFLTNFMMVSPKKEGVYLVRLDQARNIVTVPEFKAEDAIQAEVDETIGEFSFSNVDPGLYAVVIIATTGQQVPARKWKKSDYVLVNVTAADLNTTIELDTIQVP